jgi:lipopolysaccharide transport system permease protein
MPDYAWLVHYNPLAYIIETTRFMLLGVGTVSVWGLVYTVGITIGLFFLGLLVFNKTEKSFIDTV